MINNKILYTVLINNKINILQNSLWKVHVYVVKQGFGFNNIGLLRFDLIRGTEEEYERKIRC